MKKKGIAFLLGVLLLSLLILFSKKGSPFGPLFNTSLLLFAVSVGGLFFVPGYALVKRAAKLHRIFGGLLVLAALLIVVSSLLAHWDYRILLPMTTFNELSSTEYKEDVAFFAATLQKHPAYKQVFDTVAIDDLNQLRLNAEKLSRIEYVKELMALVGKFRDGHSFVLPFQLFNRSRYLPLTGYYFEDGFFITTTSDEYEELKNKKLTKINQVDVELIVAKIEALSGPENEWNGKSRLNPYLFSMDVLSCLDIVEDEREALISYQDENGNEASVLLSSEPFINWFFWAFKPINDRLPVLPNRRMPNYQLHIHDQVIELELNLIENLSTTNTMEQLAQELRSLLHTGQINRLIIDLRNNTGGNNGLYQPLIDVLKDSRAINRKEALFVLVSRHTFSAGINFLDDLRFETNATLVGEPTGAGAHHYGDARFFTLPHSGIFFFLSTKEWKAKDSLDRQKLILPDIAVNYYFEDYLQRRDPWIRAVEGTGAASSRE